MKQILFTFCAVCITVIVTLLLCEVTLRVVLEEKLVEFRTAMVQKKQKAVARLAGKGGVLDTEYAYHPYYGYTLSPRANEVPDNYYTVDRYGFRNRFDARDGKADVFQIGLFGGSAAFGTSVGDEETIASMLQSILNTRRPERYRVVNYGVGGWHLPQQLFALIREARRLDGAIFFDGVNELAFCIRNYQNGRYPADFPYFDALKILPTISNLDGALAVQALYRFQSAFPVSGWLSHWRLYLFYARWKNMRLERVADELSKQETKEAYVMPEAGEPSGIGYDEAFKRAMDDYQFYATTADRVVSGLDIKMLHVVQPQLFAGMTREEAVAATGMDRKKFNDTYDQWYFDYGRLRNRAIKIWGSGSQLLDLAEAVPREFAYAKYWNDPVHPRVAGTTIIAERIYEKLVASEWFPKIIRIGQVIRDDKLNNGFVSTTISVEMAEAQVGRLSNVSWHYRGKTVGSGRSLEFRAQTGKSNLFLTGTRADGMVLTVKIPVMVRGNLAVLQNAATDGTPFSSDPSSNPRMAIDGRDDNQKLGDMWWATRPDPALLWGIDLGLPRKIRAIEIVFRGDLTNPSATSNVIVELSDDRAFSHPVRIASRMGGPYPEGGRWLVYVNARAHRYLRVRKNDANYLVLAEVILWADPLPVDGDPGEGSAR